MPDTDPDIEKKIQEASEKLNVDIDWARSISVEEILYLLDHCPFLQIVDTKAALEDQKLELVEADSGWVIHNYGDAISSSPGGLLYGGGYFRILFGDEEDDEGGSGIVNPGKGTIVKQAFDTAVQMVVMAHQKGWSGIQIVDGHPLMQRAAWIKASQLNMTVEDFTPDQHDLAVRDRVELSENEFEVLRKEILRAG